ncbi:MAG: hypothetical protein IH591_06675 [Bacteroidales bacterium]|nr:hypothetical protein [Bacteroidales bacterium]
MEDPGFYFENDPLFLAEAQINFNTLTLTNEGLSHVNEHIMNVLQHENIMSSLNDLAKYWVS